MWHSFFIPLLIPAQIINANGDQNKDVFVVSSGHAEAEVHREEEKVTEQNVTEAELTSISVSPAEITEAYYSKATAEEKVTEDIVFIPNARRDDDRTNDDGDGVNIHGLINGDVLTNGDVMREMRVDTESPSEVYFVTGKNHDYSEKEERREESRRKMHNEKVEQKVKPKLNCTNLDCNNTVSAICGAKSDNHELKYRLFMNECFFRKVNCHFKYKYNRYQQVSREKCSNIASKYINHMMFSNPRSSAKIEKPEENRRTMQISPSRRSMSLDARGQLCSHVCPMSCTDDYDPQCAVSETGQKKVFANHCKMDHNSCLYSIVWQKRHLSECVGGKKADMQQNSGFIGWMQRVGIVDNKGRLVLE